MGHPKGSTSWRNRPVTPLPAQPNTATVPPDPTAPQTRPMHAQLQAMTSHTYSMGHYYYYIDMTTKHM